MLPCRTERGKLALKNLKTFEGVPTKYFNVKRLIVPGCTRVVCLRPTSRVFYSLIISYNIQFEKLERLSTAYGWKYKDIVAKLEAKRKEKSATYYKKKVDENVIFIHFFSYSLQKRRQTVAKSSACASKIDKINAELRLLGQLV